MIYGDCNGQALLKKCVKEKLSHWVNEGPFGNPNAIHYYGQKILSSMELARGKCARILGAEARQIIFNSGASEGISHVFHSVLNFNQDKSRNLIVTSTIEHSAVVNACKFYESTGYEVKAINVKENGELDFNEFEEVLESQAHRIALVSVMAANNETGVIQPLEKMSALCQKKKVLFFSDTTQYIGKVKNFNFLELGLDFAVTSSHKLGGVIGSGMLLVKDPEKLKPLIFGGGQEKGHRGGTQNAPGIEMMTCALQDFHNNLDKLDKLNDARVEFEKNIKSRFPQVVIFGDEASRLAGTTLISYPGLHGQAIQIELEEKDIFVTTSSACSDNDPKPSKVLRAMNIPENVARGVVRISLSTDDYHHYPQIEEALSLAYQKLAKVDAY